MALPFLKSESEESATQAMAFLAIVIVTFGLMIMNVTGALASSQGSSGLQLIIRGAFALVLSGLELLAAVALVRVMLAPFWWRKVAGTIIFLGLAWVCIQNGKRAAHLIFPEFSESAVLLEAKADLAGRAATEQQTARNAAIAATPIELANVRTQIAQLQGEQQLMASQSPEKIAEAQAMLIAQGKYFADVDGVRGEETERAMRSRGEEIRQALDLLSAREARLVEGVTVPVVTQGADPLQLGPAEQQAVLADRARRSKRAAVWIEVMLWVIELARSFGLWALVTTVAAESAKPVAATATATPEPEPDNDAEAPPAMTPEQLRGQLGGDANALKQKTGKVKIPVRDSSVLEKVMG